MSYFESRLLVEGVRAIEGESPSLSTYSSKSKNSSFESLLVERAQTHKYSTDVTLQFLQFKKITQSVYMLFALLLFIFGGLAVNKMLFTDQLTSINFFWAFTLFFIPNIIMFMVWLLFFVKPSLLQNSSLSRFSLSCIKIFDGRFNRSSVTSKDHLALLNCYLNIHFTQQLGRYQLSKLTHLLWLSYFTGATLMAVTMLATHQVDFVWQTSILSVDSFQILTQLLAFLPEQLGFPVPSIEQIQQSYLGSNIALDAESRRLAWSSLLISSLFLYGLMPRLLLYLLMSYQFKKQKHLFQPNFSDAYYVQLRQLLKPNKTNLGITDVDQHATQVNSAEIFNNQQSITSVFPTHFYPLAIELSNRQLGLAKDHLSQYNAESELQLTNVCDHQAQQDVLFELQQCKSRTIVIYVALERLPDRGLKRFIGQLTALQDRTFHLALIIENTHNKRRDNDWFQLANEVGINLDHILHIETKGHLHE